MQALQFPSLADPGREEVLAQARAAGHSAGYAAGLSAARAHAKAEREANARAFESDCASARERLDQQIAVLNEAAMALHRRTAPTLSSVQSQLVEGSLAIAEALLGKELATGDTSARAALGRALSASQDEVPHTVRLNPDDLASLDPAELGASPVVLIADSSLRRGDAVAEHADGFLDARLSTAIQRAHEVLNESHR